MSESYLTVDKNDGLFYLGQQIADDIVVPRLKNHESEFFVNTFYSKATPLAGYSKFVYEEERIGDLYSQYQERNDEVMFEEMEDVCEDPEGLTDEQLTKKAFKKAFNDYSVLRKGQGVDFTTYSQLYHLLLLIMTTCQVSATAVAKLTETYGFRLPRTSKRCLAAAVANHLPSLRPDLATTFLLALVWLPGANAGFAESYLESKDLVVGSLQWLLTQDWVPLLQIVTLIFVFIVATVFLVSALATFFFYFWIGLTRLLSKLWSVVMKILHLVFYPLIYIYQLISSRYDRYRFNAVYQNRNITGGDIIPGRLKTITYDAETGLSCVVINTQFGDISLQMVPDQAVSMMEKSKGGKVVKESAKHGSVLTPIKHWPKGLIELRYVTNDGTAHLGMGWRTGDFLMTAMHNFESGADIVLRHDKNYLPLDLSKIDSKNGFMDACAVALTPKQWSTLGASSINVVDWRQQKQNFTRPFNITTYGFPPGQDTLMMSHGECSLNGLEVEHFATTLKGFSGAPIMFGAAALGVHTTGLSSEGSANIAVIADPIVRLAKLSVARPGKQESLFEFLETKRKEKIFRITRNESSGDYLVYDGEGNSAVCTVEEYDDFMRVASRKGFKAYSNRDRDFAEDLLDDYRSRRYDEDSDDDYSDDSRDDDQNDLRGRNRRNYPSDDDRDFDRSSQDEFSGEESTLKRKAKKTSFKQPMLKTGNLPSVLSVPSTTQTPVTPKSKKSKRKKTKKTQEPLAKPATTPETSQPKNLKQKEQKQAIPSKDKEATVVNGEIVDDAPDQPKQQKKTVGEQTKTGFQAAQPKNSKPGRPNPQ